MKWLPEHDRVIAESMAECGFNTSSAFEMSRRKLLHKFSIVVSRKAVSSRYYRKFPDLNLMARNILEEKAYRNYMEAHKPWYVKLWSAVQSMLNLNQRL